jgi:hypothetical protein
MDNHDGLILSPEKLAQELRKRGDDWADKDAAFKALEETQKTILAESFVLNTGSVTEREARARISAPFKEHLEATAKARHEANKARVAYDIYRTYVDLMRTNATTQRALVNLQ